MRGRLIYLPLAPEHHAVSPVSRISHLSNKAADLQKSTETQTPFVRNRCLVTPFSLSGLSGSYSGIFPLLCRHYQSKWWEEHLAIKKVFLTSVFIFKSATGHVWCKCSSSYMGSAKQRDAGGQRAGNKLALARQWSQQSLAHQKALSTWESNWVRASQWHEPQVHTKRYFKIQVALLFSFIPQTVPDPSVSQKGGREGKSLAAATHTPACLGWGGGET